MSWFLLDLSECETENVYLRKVLIQFGVEDWYMSILKYIQFSKCIRIVLFTLVDDSQYECFTVK